MREHGSYLINLRGKQSGVSRGIERAIAGRVRTTVLARAQLIQRNSPYLEKPDVFPWARFSGSVVDAVETASPS